MSGCARISIPTAEGMMIASMARRPKAMRCRNAGTSSRAQRAASDGATAVMIETATTP